jgi:hypothetical protein
MQAGQGIELRDATGPRHLTDAADPAYRSFLFRSSMTGILHRQDTNTELTVRLIGEFVEPAAYH